DRVDAGVLLSRTTRYRDWLARRLQERHIPRLAAPKGVRKEDFVLPYYRRLDEQEGVACVLSAVEMGSTFFSYSPKQGAGQPAIRRGRKLFQPLYFYVWDAVLGRVCLCLGTYLPFNLSVILNGHDVAAQYLTAHGVGYRRHDNAFL